jgi:hypothetical protein
LPAIVSDRSREFRSALGATVKETVASADPELGEVNVIAEGSLFIMVQGQPMGAVRFTCPGPPLVGSDKLDEES